MAAKPKNPAKKRYPKLRKLLLIFLPAAVALAAIAVVGFRYFQEWRATDLATKAMENFEHGNYRMAWLQIRSAREMRPDNPVVLRNSAILDEGFGAATALDFWEHLSRMAPLSADDLERRARAAARLGNKEQFEAAAADLESAGRTAEAGRLRMGRDLLRGGMDRAIEEAERMAEASNDLEMKLDVARLLIRRHADRLASSQGGKGPDVAEKITGIIDSLEGTPQEPEALALGLTFLKPSSEKLQAWAGRAMKDLSATNPALLPAASVEIAAGRSSKEDFYRRLRPVYDAAPLDRRAAFASWLTRHGMPKEALALITSQEASESKEAFIARADALGAMENWAAVIEAANVSGKTPESIRFTAKARAEFSLGRKQSAEKSAADAVRAAAHEGELSQVTALMDQIGMGPVVDSTLVELCGDPRLADAAFRAARERFTWREPRGGGLLAAAYSKAATAAPRSTALKDYDDFNTLVGALTGHAPTIAKRGPMVVVTPEETAAAIEAAPADPALRISHALALMQAGRAPEAARVFDDFTIYFNRLPPPLRAAMAAIMNAGGQPSLGAEMAEAVDTSLLSPQELNLLHLPPPTH